MNSLTCFTLVCREREHPKVVKTQKLKMFHEEDVFGIDEELDMDGFGMESEAGDSWRGTRSRMRCAGADSDSDLDTDEFGTSIETDPPLSGRGRNNPISFPTPGLDGHDEDRDDDDSVAKHGTSLPIAVPFMHMQARMDNHRRNFAKIENTDLLGGNVSSYAEDIDDERNFLPPHVHFRRQRSLSHAGVVPPSLEPIYHQEMSYKSPTPQKKPDLVGGQAMSLQSSFGALKGRSALRLRNEVFRNTGWELD